LKLYTESGVDEAYGDTPCDYFAVAVRQATASHKFESEFKAGDAVSVEEASAKAVEAASKLGRMDELKAALKAFDLCPLKKFSSSTVVGRGVENPALLCIFDVPNADEDRSGELAVGEAGELFLKILGAIGRTLDTDTFAMPLVPWRPAGGRAPTKEELACAVPFAVRAIEILKPKAILAMGPSSSSFLLASSEPLTSLRGNWGSHKGIPVMPTFAPPYLLANREAKKKTWEDVQAVEEKLKES
jgi:DNA polymerase